MRPSVAAPLVTLVAAVFLITSPASAQDPPPPIGLFAVDIRGSFPGFPGGAALAESRAMAESELPGRGPGVEVGAHVYPLHWKAMTIGLGGQLLLARAASNAVASAGVRGATATLASFSPQLSFNFGNGDGWSYVSGGIGATTWSLVPDGAMPLAIDETRLQTVNYGGGARWFAKPHVAFTFDVRFYDITSGVAQVGFRAHPRTRLIVMGGGVSFK